MSEMTHAEIFAQSPIKIGARYRFDYPNEFTSLPEYSAHRGCAVTVLRSCTESEADILWDDFGDGKGSVVCDRMFMVRADDGWEAEAWESELEDIVNV